MKSELKQTQETQFLVEKFDTQFEKLKKALPSIIVVAVLLLSAALTYGYFVTQSEATSARGWTALYFADTEPGPLDEIAQDFQGTAASLWAKNTLADAFMARALEKVYIDRPIAEKLFEQAVEEYKVVSEKATDPFLKSKATFGLAQAQEGLGDRDSAIANYKKTASISGVYPEFTSEASKRAAWLSSKEGEEFFAWYTTVRPTTPVLETNPTTPAIPGLPNINFPAIAPPAAANTPAPEGAAPAAALPSATAPAATAPAATAPATTTPTETAPATAPESAPSVPATTEPATTPAEPTVPAPAATPNETPATSPESGTPGTPASAPESQPQS